MGKRRFVPGYHFAAPFSPAAGYRPEYAALPFQTELSKEETALFLNTLSETLHQQGFAAGYALAQEKLRQYPSCGSLLCSTAMTLEGALAMYPPKDGRGGGISAADWTPFTAVHGRPEPGGLGSRRYPSRYNRLMRKKEYAAAQCLLEKMSGPSLVDKGQLEGKSSAGTGGVCQGSPADGAKTAECPYGSPRCADDPDGEML